jgi:molybdopterin-guanine dinucleotide biosynthesis protein A
MGRDKAAIVLAGETLLERTVGLLAGVFPDVLVVGRPADERTPGVPARFLPDEEPGLGPLGGIATALAASGTRWVFVAACDMPFLGAGLVERLWAMVARETSLVAAVPTVGERVEPLAAFYSKDALGPAREALAAGELSAAAFAWSLDPASLEVDEGSAEASALRSVNTEAELADAEKELS